MNIGIFTDTYDPQINGVVTSIKTLKAQLEKRGHKVYIFTTTTHDYKEDSSDVFRLHSMPFLLSPQHRLATMYSLKHSKIVKSLNLDIIHNQTEFSLGIFAKIISKRLHLPIVHTYHTIWSDYAHYIVRRKNSKLTPKAIQLYSKVFCNHFDTVIVPSEKTKQALKQYGVEKPIEIIPNGINLAPFRSSNYSENQIKETRNKFGIADTDKVVVYVGRVAHEKSINIVINEMPKLIAKGSSIKFLIVGDGPAKSSLESLANNLKIKDNIIFAGMQPWEKIGLFYNLADVFISASTSETQGLTFIEAMASGTAVVAKYDKCLDGVIADNYNGRFFYNNSDISNVLYDLLTDDEKRKTITDNALITANSYSAEKFGENVERVYLETIKKSFNSID